MYAVIQSGGKQHRVQAGETIQLEKLPGESGDAVTFDEVLLVGNDEDTLHVGTPHVEGAQVTGTIVSQGRGKKLNIFTYKRRKNYTRRLGHRQPYTQIEITEITAPKE